MSTEYFVAATETTPEISFDRHANTISIKGESYPENSANFFAPFFNLLEDYLATESEDAIELNIELVYFNSSSSQVLHDIFDKLEEQAKKGRKVTVNWRYHHKNDMSLEYGEEFAEDLQFVNFCLVEFSG